MSDKSVLNDRSGNSDQTGLITKLGLKLQTAADAHHQSYTNLANALSAYATAKSVTVNKGQHSKGIRAALFQKCMTLHKIHGEHQANLHKAIGALRKVLNGGPEEAASNPPLVQPNIAVKSAPAVTRQDVLNLIDRVEQLLTKRLGRQPSKKEIVKSLGTLNAGFKVAADRVEKAAPAEINVGYSGVVKRLQTISATAPNGTDRIFAQKALSKAIEQKPMVQKSKIVDPFI